jgi:hypothetical protein
LTLFVVERAFAFAAAQISAEFLRAPLTQAVNCPRVREWHHRHAAPLL